MIFVEGQTEKNSIAEFLKRGLDPKLPQPVGISVIAFDGFGEYLSKIGYRVERYLTGKLGHEIIAAIGLIDLYGPTIFPAGLSPSQKAAWGKQELEKRVGHSKFRQYFAVHETEAWFLAHQEILPKAVREALPGQCSRPETINTNEPPSKLLGHLYQRRLNKPYKKVAESKKLFLDCDPTIVAAKCPHFSQMLVDMEQLAREALENNN